MSPLLEKVAEAVIEGQAEEAASAVRVALEGGLGPAVVLNDGLIATMGDVGQRFERGELFLPEMLLAVRAMQRAVDVLKPLLQAGEIGAAGKVAIGTVKGDLHDIGKNLVATMLKGAGFELLDLGNDVAPDRFVEAARAGAEVVALSALLTTTMVNMKGVVDALVAAGLREHVRVVVGGAPVTDAFARQIGADGYAPDANRAVGLVRSLLAATAAEAGRVSRLGSSAAPRAPGFGSMTR